MAALDMAGGVGPERRQRVDPLDAVRIEPARAFRSDHHRPVLLGADEHEADSRLLAQARQQARIKGLDLFERQTGGVSGKVDEPQAARPHHHHLGRRLRPGLGAVSAHGLSSVASEHNCVVDTVALRGESQGPGRH